MASFRCLNFLFIGIVIATVSANSTCYNEESCLYDSLMKYYNPEIRPSTKKNKPVSVEITLDLRNILDLDEKEEILVSVLGITAKWKDDFLSWDTNTYDVDRIIISAKLLWKPDFAITNSVDNFYDRIHLQDFRAKINDNGAIRWQYGGIFKTNCDLDISYYPFDTQMCTIVFENWAFREKLVNLTSGIFKTAGVEENTLWDLTSSSVDRETFINEDGFKYPRITFTMNLKRKTKYYMFNIIIPCAMVLCAAMGVFWLPPDCGEKISLSITVLLAFSVFQIVIMDNTPVNSETTPMISQLVLTVMTMSTLSLMSSILATYLHFKGSANRVPRVIRIIAFKCLARLLCLRDELPDEAQWAKIRGSRNKISNISPIGNDEKCFENGVKSPSSIHLEDGEEGNDVEIINSSSQMRERKQRHHQLLDAILQKLCVITDELQERKRDDDIMNEWKMLAKIIDRLLFWICTIALIVIIVCISLPYCL